jgi:hypothetical protein
LRNFAADEDFDHAQKFETTFARERLISLIDEDGFRHRWRPTLDADYIDWNFAIPQDSIAGSGPSFVRLRKLRHFVLSGRNCEFLNVGFESNEVLTVARLNEGQRYQEIFLSRSEALHRA